VASRGSSAEFAWMDDEGPDLLQMVSGPRFDLFLGDTRFESRPGHEPEIFRSLLQYFHENDMTVCRNQISPRPLPSASFPFHYALIIFSFGGMGPERRTASLNNKESSK
jgi:hypothetical protein